MLAEPWFSSTWRGLNLKKIFSTAKFLHKVPTELWRINTRKNTVIQHQNKFQLTSTTIQHTNLNSSRISFSFDSKGMFRTMILLVTCSLLVARLREAFGALKTKQEYTSSLTKITHFVSLLNFPLVTDQGILDCTKL